MRLFVAVDPSREAVESLRSALPVDERLRWTPADQWHLTLAFLGEVDEAKLPDLRDRLARAAARSRPLDLGVVGAGTFPRQARRGRVLWCGLDGDVEALGRLAAGCAAAGRRCGIAVDDKPFRAHLTLGRSRARNGSDMTATVTALSGYVGPRWTATDLRLVRSHVGSAVRHETLQAWPLGPAASDAHQA